MLILRSLGRRLVKLVTPRDVWNGALTRIELLRGLRPSEADMNVDDFLRFLAPLTPAVLPVVVFIWYKTRRELRAIRQELITLRQTSMPLDPRLDDLLEAVEAINAEVARLTEAQQLMTKLLPDRLAATARVERGSTSEPS